ncbi:MAG: tRNA (N(6)-L-threonylcarbamoyladenosine(37)-C(2))-methylthiotransferase MtaB [Firmicutes bacterium]|nr:tRNA (N(6)-L-threonylcarbamoyladenosine(37)-C(2))-methylthiotransferase MtaB [Bacillota bacterium]
MKFNIITFGCKVNQYESNMMKENMLHHNFYWENDYLKSDIVIINTCTVTNTADKKCLKMVRSVKRNCPDKIIVVTGCSTQNKVEKYEDLGLDIILGNVDKSKIALIIEKYLETKRKVKIIEKNRHLEFEDMFINDYHHVRAFLKIEDGCDNFCSYCIIPFVRGSVRCKDFATVLKEAQSLVDNNHQELVLTGIHTGHYNYEGKDLSDLILELEKIKGLKRIRISSIEITELDEKFMNVLKTSKKLCNHLHIPLQAGSDEILKSMNRKYDLNYFKNKIQEIRRIRPDISITTDIIVGFPGETEQNFLETLKTSEQLNFAQIHVFPYSKREGTKAALMENQIDEKIKKDRVKRLIELSKSLEKKYYEKFKNKELDILVENIENNKSYGHTSNYLYVELDELLEIGKIYRRIL